jgi:hypothetical protein
MEQTTAVAAALAVAQDAMTQATRLGQVALAQPIKAMQVETATQTQPTRVVVAAAAPVAPEVTPREPQQVALAETVSHRLSPDRQSLAAVAAAVRASFLQPVQAAPVLGARVAALLVATRTLGLPTRVAAAEVVAVVLVVVAALTAAPAALVSSSCQSLRPTRQPSLAA